MRYEHLSLFSTFYLTNQVNVLLRSYWVNLGETGQLYNDVPSDASLGPYQLLRATRCPAYLLHSRVGTLVLGSLGYALHNTPDCVGLWWRRNPSLNTTVKIEFDKRLVSSPQTCVNI